MVITPTNSGNLLAGAGLGIFSWGAFLKADKIPLIRKLVTTKRKESAFSWMNRNKGMSLLGLETINYSIHGITSSNAVMFALGNTIFNVLMLWVYLPIRMVRLRKEHTKSVLKRVTS